MAPTCESSCPDHLSLFFCVPSYPKGMAKALEYNIQKTEVLSNLSDAVRDHIGVGRNDYEQQAALEFRLIPLVLEMSEQWMSLAEEQWKVHAWKVNALNMYMSSPSRSRPHVVAAWTPASGVHILQATMEAWLDVLVWDEDAQQRFDYLRRVVSIDRAAAGTGPITVRFRNPQTNFNALLVDGEYTKKVPHIAGDRTTELTRGNVTVTVSTTATLPPTIEVRSQRFVVLSHKRFTRSRESPLLDSLEVVSIEFLMKTPQDVYEKLQHMVDTYARNSNQKGGGDTIGDEYHNMAKDIQDIAVAGVKQAVGLNRRTTTQLWGAVRSVGRIFYNKNIRSRKLSTTAVSKRMIALERFVLYLDIVEDESKLQSVDGYPFAGTELPPQTMHADGTEIYLVLTGWPSNSEA